MDDSKVKAITEWPVPTTVCSICSFLGLANFYRRFIKDYATLAKPLTDLTQKDKTFTWGSAVLQYEVVDSFFPLYIYRPCLRVLLLHSPFLLSSSLTLFVT